MKNIIILDIGTQFVKALLLEIDKEKGKGIIKSWVKESLCKENDEAIAKAIKAIRKKSGIKLQEVFLGMGSDFLKGKTTTLCYKRENPEQKIDLTELKYLVQKIQWRAFDDIRKELASETDFLETDARLINAYIVDIKIDGYSISDPVGFQGQCICLSIFNSYASFQQLDAIEKLISRLDLSLIGLAPVSYALFHCLDLEKSPKGNALIIDVGGKATEIVLVRNGGELIKIKNFHLGGWMLSRALAEFLGLGIEEAEIVKAKYSKGEVSPAAKKKLEKLFTPSIFSWFNGIKFILDEFFKEYKLLPSKIFLCGEGSRFPLIEEILKKNRNMRVGFIMQRDILGIENKTRFQEIPALALAKLCLDLQEQGKSVFYSILKRVIKLIQS